MTPESPRADVELTEAECRIVDEGAALYGWATADEAHREMVAAVERILADRLAAVEKSRDAYRGAMRNAEALAAHEMVRREQAEAERDRNHQWWTAETNRSHAAEAERDHLRARLLAVEAEHPRRSLPSHLAGLGAPDICGTCWDGSRPGYAIWPCPTAAVLASPSTQEWPDCATYPNLGCVCRGGLQPSKGTCTRKRTGDLTPVASPSAHTQRCSTPCDPDCDVACHEVHQVAARRNHDVRDCIQRQCAAENTSHTQRDTETAARALREAKAELERMLDGFPAQGRHTRARWATEYLGIIIDRRADSLATEEES